MAKGKWESSNYDGAASTKSKKAKLTFCLNQILIYPSLIEEFSDEDDENDISIGSETEGKIILEEHTDIDNIDNNTSIIAAEIEVPEASCQTVKSSRKRLANILQGRMKEKKKNRN